MLFIRKEPCELGCYPPVCEANRTALPDGYILWPEELDRTQFQAYNGFVVLTTNETGDTVNSYKPNVEAWEAWKASQPTEPENPAPADDTSVWDELDAAYQEGVNGV